jgi:hypothetical protein
MMRNRFEGVLALDALSPAFSAALARLSGGCTASPSSKQRQQARQPTTRINTGRLSSILRLGGQVSVTVASASVSMMRQCLSFNSDATSTLFYSLTNYKLLSD